VESSATAEVMRWFREAGRMIRPFKIISLLEEFGLLGYNTL
jgi:EAL domain-containing protein (putative c-di-GMP-specific phosphodiesterase class I)